MTDMIQTPETAANIATKQPALQERLHPAPADRRDASAAVDGFQRALDLEHDALCAMLSAAQPRAQERLTRLIADLYAILRTPIFPKRAYLSFGDALLNATASEGHSVKLYGVLASTTADKETSSFLRCAAIFRRYGFTPRVRLLLVRWENLVDIRRQDLGTRAHSFAQQVRSATEQARYAGFAEAITPIDVEIDAESAEILYPADVGAWSRRVTAAMREPRHACPSLARDVTWSRDFYARQTSLSQLGEEQALLDLAIRRAVGQRLSAAQESEAQGDSVVSALITSELHKRFLACYAASLPILNIDVRASISRTSKSA